MPQIERTETPGALGCGSSRTPRAIATLHARWPRLLAMLAVAFLLFVVLAGMTPLQAGSGGQQSVLLHLHYAEFDPVLGAPVRAAGDMLPAPLSGRHPYLVQLVGPILDDWKAQISAAGAEVVDYIPDYTYVVLIDSTGIVRLRSFAFVRWVGYLQPAYRVDPSLLAAQDNVTVTVSLFPGASSSAVAAAVGARGGEVLTDAQSAATSTLRAVVNGGSIRFLASLPAVAWIEPYRRPRLWNEVARSIMGVPPVWTSHGLRGDGQIIAIADTGLDVGSVVSVTGDFRGRIVAAHALGRANDWSDPDGHGTHVAGSAVGSGASSGSDPVAGEYGMSHAGVAPEAGLVVQSVLDAEGHLGGLPADLTVLLQQAYADGARVHSNSWGVAEDDGGRVYDRQAQQVDRFMWEHPDMVVLFAAGNDGEDDNRDGVVDLGSVTTPATAKNGLTVGASESVRLTGGYSTGAICSTWGGCWPEEFPVTPLFEDRLSNNLGGMAAFSSRGPAPDGRLKPDLVAPGTNIISTRSSLAPASDYWGVYDEYYAYNGGTSMSTPLAAGAAAIVRQYYQTLGRSPSAALIKATLLAGAIDMTPGQFGGRVEVPPAPNNVEGWGRLDLTNALFPIPPRRVSYVDSSQGLNTGQSAVYTYTVASAAVPLRVIVAWTDYPGSLLAAPNLVNDLDLQVTAPATATIRSGVERTPDRLNNVEGVILDEPAPGVYRITVRGRNVPFGPQRYALVVSGDLAEPPLAPTVPLSSLPGFGTAGSSVTVRWGISGGTVITATSLLWDTDSHQSDHRYANTITVPVTSARSYTAVVTLPVSGTVYLSACAWVDGREYYAPIEHSINVVAVARSVFLPLILTYPAPEPTPTPPATMTPAAAVQLIQNGGFEDAAPQSPPWHQVDQADANGLLVADFWPRSGRWSAWMGGVYSDRQQIYQDIVVPPAAAYANLVFHWYMNSEDDPAQAHDILYVRLLNAAGENLATIVQRDNTSRREAWVPTRYSWVGDFPYAGQTIRLSFEMVTNGSRNTNLFLDDISFSVSSGPIDALPEGVTEHSGR